MSSIKVKSEKSKRKSSKSTSGSSASADAATGGGESEEPQDKSDNKKSEESTKSSKSNKKSKKKSKKKKSGDEESQHSIGSGQSFYHYDSDSSSNSGSDISLPEDVKNKKFRKVMAKEASKSSLLDSASFRNGSFRRRSILSDEDDTDSREEDELSEFQMDLTFLKSSFHNNNNHMTTNPAMSVSSSPGAPDTSTHTAAATTNKNNVLNNLHNSIPNMNENIMKKTKLGRVKSSGCEGRERPNNLRDSGRMTSGKESKEKKDKQKKEDGTAIGVAISVDTGSKKGVFNWASVAQDSDKKRGSRKSTTTRKDKSPDPGSASAEVGYTKPGLRRSKSSGDSSTDWSMFRNFAKRTKQLANTNKKGIAAENEAFSTTMTTASAPKLRKNKKVKDAAVVAEESEEDGILKKRGKKPIKEESYSIDAVGADGRESKKKKVKKDKMAPNVPDADETLAVDERRISADSFDIEAEKHDWQALAQQQQQKLGDEEGSSSKHNWQALAQSEEQKKKGREKKDKKKLTEKEGGKGRRSLFEGDGQGNNNNNNINNNRNAAPRETATESDYVYNWSPKKPTKSPKKSKLKKTHSSGEGSMFPSLPLTNQESSSRFADSKVEKTRKLKLKKSISVGGTSLSSSSSRPLIPSLSYEKQMANRPNASNEGDGSSGVQSQKSKASQRSDESKEESDKEFVEDAHASNDSSSQKNDIAFAIEEPLKQALPRGGIITRDDETNEEENGLPPLQPFNSESSHGLVESLSSGSDDSPGEQGQCRAAETHQATTGTCSSTAPGDGVSFDLSLQPTIPPIGSNTTTEHAPISWTKTDSSTGSQRSTHLILDSSSLSREDSMGGSTRTEESSRSKNATTSHESEKAKTVVTEEAPKPRISCGSSTSSFPNYTVETAHKISEDHNQDADEAPDSRQATASTTSSTYGETSSTAETSSWSDGSQMQCNEKINKMETLDPSKGSFVGAKTTGPTKATKKKKKKSIAKPNIQGHQNTTLDRGEEEHQEAMVSYANSIMKLFSDDPKQYSDEAAMALLQEFPQSAKMKYALESSSFRGGQGKTRHYLLSLLCALGANKQCVSMCFNLHPDAIHKFDEHVGTPLHYAISFGIAASFSREMWSDTIFETVEFLLAQEPLLLSSQHNNLSQSALHQAILSLCPAPESTVAGQQHSMNNYEQLTEIADVVVSMLLENHSSIATLPDSKNLLPLHLAALRVVPVELLQRILKEHTAACLVKCFSKGWTPLHYALQVFGLAASTTVPRKSWTSSPSLEDHAANIGALLQENAAAAQIQDNSGDLPLHILFSAFYGQYSMDVESDRLRCDASCSTFKNIATLLTLAHPEAANTPGSSGKTPTMIVKKHEGGAVVIEALTNAKSRNSEDIAK